MNLTRYWKVVIASWRLIGICGLIGLVLAGAYTFTATAQYKATAGVYFYLSGGDSTSQLVQGSTFAQNQVRSYALLAEQPVVLDPVIKQLNLPYTSTQLARTVTTNVPLDTVVLEITVTNPSAEESAAIANAIANQMGAAVSGLSPSSTNANATTVKASTVAPAQVPQFPSSPNKRLDIALGVILGLIVGVAIAVIREVTNNKVRTTEIVKELTQIPVVGDVPFDSATSRQALADQNQNDPRSEAFRKLSANFEFVCYDRSVHSLIVTSPMHNEGKSVTALNLAYAMSAHIRVILVDADLRRPAIAQLAGLDNDHGLSTVLTGRDSLDQALQPTTAPNLRVLTSGAIPPNSAELLGSNQMRQTLTELKQLCDLVILDTPPVLPASDSTVVSRLVDGALVVISAKKTKRQQLQDTLEDLSLSGGNVLGIVLNQTDPKAIQSDGESRIKIG